MPAGYSKTPLVKKLGIKENHRVWLPQAPSHFMDLLGELPDGVEVLDDPDPATPYIQFFTRERADLAHRFPEMKQHLAYDGTLWISWPKKASKIESDLTGNVVREIGLANGLVDVKVCAVDEDWSGLKFMYRMEDRP